jgi:hypothetical protein
MTASHQQQPDEGHPAAAHRYALPVVREIVSSRRRLGDDGRGEWRIPRPARAAHSTRGPADRDSPTR